MSKGAAALSAGNALPASQEELFDVNQLPAGLELLMPVEEQRKCFTGEQVVRNVERAKGIASALAGGIGINRIAKAFRCSIHTVMAIRDRHPELVAAERKMLSELMGRAARLTVERFMECLEAGTVDPRSLPIAAGIFTDKRLLLEGEATSRIEHSSGPKTVDADQVRAAFERLKRGAIDSESDGGGSKPQQIEGNKVQKASLATTSEGGGGGVVERAGAGQVDGLEVEKFSVKGGPVASPVLVQTCEKGAGSE